MQSKVKLSKRQIKEDKFTSFMLNAKDRFLENWQYWVISAVVVALVVVAVSYYATSQSNKEREASARYSTAVLEFRNGQSDIAILSLQQVVDNYSSTTIAEQARFMLGTINFEEKNYAEAITHFEKYLERFKNNKLNRAGAHAGLAACYENQGDYEQAAANFEEAVNVYADGPLAGDYMVGAMRCYLYLGNVEKARGFRDRIADEFPQTELANRAERLFTEMSAAAG